MKTQIIHEEKTFIVCWKPGGFPVQSAKLGVPDMESELKNYLHSKGITNPYLAVVHRLDQPVQGLLVFAKTREAAGDLSNQLQSGKMKKIYRACVYGIPEEKEATLVHTLIKESANNRSIVLSEKEIKALPPAKQKGAKEAVLSYRIIEGENNFYPDYSAQGGKACELEIKLTTGRFHQIRAQLSAIGHPILGDIKYGNEESVAEAKRLNISTLCLTAYRLSFINPVTGKDMEFTCDSLLIPEKN